MKNNLLNNKQKVFVLLLLAVLIYFPIFNHLDVLAIKLWDESRLAMNAINMMHNDNFIVTYFDRNPDMWNTKPPLLIWLQVISMRIFGINEVAFRLPSALAALMTIIGILVFSIRYLKSFWFGYIAVLVLISSLGYVDIHVSRTGDYDTLLTLFTTFSSLMFFVYTETKKTKFLYFFYLFLAFGVLTKSIAGLLFLPAIFIYALIYKQVIPLLKNKHLYFGAISFLFLVLGYYLLREYYNPGYITAVYKNELGGRYLEVIENHTEDSWFYFNILIASKFKNWYLFVPLGLSIGLFIKDKRVKKITIFSFILSFIYLIIISNAQTKIEWYDAPMFPFLSIIVTVFIYFIFDLLNSIDWLTQKLQFNILPFIFLFLIFIFPYQKIIKKTYKPVEYSYDEPYYRLSYFIKKNLKNGKELDGNYILDIKYNPHIKFYLHMAKELGINITIKDFENLNNNDIVITQDNKIKNYVENNYKFESLYNYNGVYKYKILGNK